MVVEQVLVAVEIGRRFGQGIEVVYKLLAKSSGRCGAKSGKLPLGVAARSVGDKARINVIVMIVRKPRVERRKLSVRGDADLFLASGLRLYVGFILR